MSYKVVEEKNEEREEVRECVCVIEEGQDRYREKERRETQ